MVTIPSTFRDANFNEIPYDGSPVQWRVSIYGLCIIENSLLIIKNRKEKFYDVPGGGIEMDESLETALQREGLEEAGYEITPLQPITVLSDWFYHVEQKQFYKSLQMFWLAQAKKVLDKPTEEEIDEVLLVPLSKLSKYELYPQVQAAITTAKEMKLM